MTGSDQAIVVTGGGQAGITRTAAALRQLGYADVIAAGAPEQALALLAPSSRVCPTLVCTLDDPAFDSLHFLSQVFQRQPQLALVLLYADPAGELAAALALAARMGIAPPAALQQPFAPAQLAALLAAPGDTTNTAGGSLGADELRRAWRDDPALSRLALFYQPRMGIRSGALEGVETLPHWLAQGQPVLGPDRLIPLALQGGLADELSRAIAQRAVIQTAAWHQLGLPLFNTLNIPLSTFVAADFGRYLQDLCNQHGLDPGMLTLEVAEASVMQSAADCVEVLNLLRDQQRSRALSESGRSSRGAATVVNELKITSTFARTSAFDAAQHATLAATITLARQLGMRVVAVGVDSHEDWRLAASLTCDLAQGEYCAPPLTPAALVEFWRQHKERQAAATPAPASASTRH